MSGPGYRLSPSIRGPGYDKSLGYGYRPRYQKPREILRENDARNIVHHYLSSSGNPGMKVGTITERAYYFEVEILTEKNTAAHKIAVDKRTGWMGSIN